MPSPHAATVGPAHAKMRSVRLQSYRHSCSAGYALRSYWYLLLHALVAAPAAAVFGATRGKVLVFVATRIALGTASAFTEAMLYR